MEKLYYRPIVQTDAARPDEALTLAGGWAWFTEVEQIARGGAREIIPAVHLPFDVAERLTARRAPVAGLGMESPKIMGILNLTPDSFSDGGRFDDFDAALERAETLIEAGADILDIGGESTRPGAQEVPEDEEIERTAPVIAALRDEGFSAPISIDTRKAMVGDAAVEAGADMLNDVSAMEFDPAMAELAAITGLPICLMHAQGLPETMQDDPSYGDVLLDVYDYLEERIELAEASGILRDRIVVDPGIGFGKTLQHNLTLLRGLSLFHALGCPILLGVSRKRFIGTIGGTEAADARAPGTLAVTLMGLGQGAQIHRVHDVAEIAQGLRLWRAITEGYEE
ncbi:dihydropteroate synthase [Sinirhodobacter sp. WL0062]|uniref:Dihydropteroate synthase n=1 Tax=Rhodobacter flavimaris TaxID=2907145 RepID=A0ABS8YT61_9RHOB|nr:dihydropteroate synthase [Sinirhodobacter sp. WL0062]MCE5972653.1 dihydropteroate synthase [Sinirhodobacter sp. WL0062]